MKITRDELLIAAFKLFMSVNYEKASFAELGKKGVLALMCESTNVEREGYTPSERTVGRTLRHLGQVLVQHAKSTKQIHRNKRYVCRIYR